MWFVDQAQLVAQGGAGGNGCAAMARPPFSRHPYPDGGDGGDGGEVVLLADPQLATLLDFQFRHEFRGARGGHGGSNNKTGKRGEPYVIRVPIGTAVYDQDTKQLIGDLLTPMEQIVVARAGAGGSGNTNASRATPGRPGQWRRLRLELKLIADVGLIGVPNAGKSSLLARISTARPKIAPYPFTTRTPVLGVVAVPDAGSFVACDIPGLIEGAHEGRGLGMQFLRHVERTRLLVHVIDMAACDGRDPIQAYHQVNHELRAYSPMLATRPQIIAANKMDLPEAKVNLERFRACVSAPVLATSCATTVGISELVYEVWRRLQSLVSAPLTEPANQPGPIEDLTGGQDG